MPPLVTPAQEREKSDVILVELVGSKLICHLTLRVVCTTPDACLPPHTPLAFSSRLRQAASPDAEAELAAADEGALLWLPSWNIADRGTSVLRDPSLVNLLNAELSSTQSGWLLIHYCVLIVYTRVVQTFSSKEPKFWLQITHRSQIKFLL